MDFLKKKRISDYQDISPADLQELCAEEAPPTPEPQQQGKRRKGRKAAVKLTAKERNLMKKQARESVLDKLREKKRKLGISDDVDLEELNISDLSGISDLSDMYSSDSNDEANNNERGNSDELDDLFLATSRTAPQTTATASHPFVRGEIIGAAKLPKRNEDASASSSGPALEKLFDGVADIGPTASAPLPAAATLAGGKEILKRLARDPVSGHTVFFFLDAKESPGRGGGIYLFGKVNDVQSRRWLSCCLRIDGLSRTVFVLPRDPSKIGDVIQELNAVARESGIKSPLRYKPVQRWYGFEQKDVPRGRATWLKVRYAANEPALGIPESSDCAQYSTFSRVFGDRRSFLENFILKRGLKGPSWLALTPAPPSVAAAAAKAGLPPPEPSVVEMSSRVSWAALEIYVPSYKLVTSSETCTLPPPPLTVLSVGLVTHLTDGPSRGPKAAMARKTNEIVGVSLLLQDNVSMDSAHAGAKVSHRWSYVRRIDTSRPFPLDMADCFRAINCPAPKQCGSERAMLEDVLTLLERVDPDMICGHNFLGFDLDVLLHRMQAHSLSGWSKLGRLRLRTMPQLQHGAGGTGQVTWEERGIMAGRLVADTYLLSREYLRESQYKLSYLAVSLGLIGLDGRPCKDASILELGKVDMEREFGTGAGIVNVLSRADSKAFLCFGLLHKLQAIPLTKRLTNLVGNLWSRTLIGSRAERIEYYLMHRFHSAKFITPDRQRSPKEGDGITEGDAGTGRKRGKAKYAGGMVLEPVRGLYNNWVLLLDFNSLYPSVIQEFNVCFTTVTRPAAGEEGDDFEAVPPLDGSLICSCCTENVDMAAMERWKSLNTGLPYACKHRNILPRAVRDLVVSRRDVKKVMKGLKPDDPQYAALDIRQKAIKLTANSIYGCLGFQMGRFFAMPIAELVTRKGREALGRTVQLVPSVDPSLTVIYGDTDSVMIDSGIPNSESVDAALKLANLVKLEVNKQYRALEIELDGVFKTILLVRKKKYAALTLVDPFAKPALLLAPSNVKQEVKGLDLVRHDWCPLSAEICKEVLGYILSGDNEDTVLDNLFGFLGSIGKAAKAGSIPLFKYVISKSVTKDPKHYLDKAVLPHVSVALRMQKNNQRVSVGDFIQYVICKATDAEASVASKKLCDRAYHVDEVKHSGGTLLPDVEWYLTTQIHPPVMRLVEHLEGASSHAVAHALGIEKAMPHTDSHSAHRSVGTVKYNIVSTELNVSDSSLYANVEHLMVPCLKCKSSVDVATAIHKSYLNLAVTRLSRGVGGTLSPDVLRQRIAGINRIDDGSADIVEEVIDVADAGAVSGLSSKYSLVKESLRRANVGVNSATLLTCTDCSRPLSVARVYNAAVLLAISSIKKYYASRNARGASVHGSKGLPAIADAYPEHELRSQLAYLASIFRRSRICTSVRPELIQLLTDPAKADGLKNVIKTTMGTSAMTAAAEVRGLCRALLSNDGQGLEDFMELIFSADHSKEEEKDVNRITQFVRQKLYSDSRMWVRTEAIFGSMGVVPHSSATAAVSAPAVNALADPHGNNGVVTKSVEVDFAGSSRGATATVSI